MSWREGEVEDVLQDLAFPFSGIDQDRAFGRQRPGTTAVAVNVRAVDPETGRIRGASRPGLVRFITDDVPAGSTKIQHLNTIVVSDVEAVTGVPDWPDGIDDPSSPGPPGSWGTGIILDDPILGPITGSTEGSRNPGGPGSSQKVRPRKVRNGGNARPPVKNGPRPPNYPPLDQAILDITPRFKFQGSAEYSYQINLTGTPQDESAAFTGVVCYPYRPAVGIGPPPSLTPAGLPSLQAEKNAYFARIAYQNVTGIQLVREWWASADSNGLPLPSGVCSCADVHEFGGYDGSPNNSVPCP